MVTEPSPKARSKALITLLNEDTSVAVVTGNGQRRVFTLLHDAHPVLLNLGESGALDITPWAVRLFEAQYTGVWELPVLGVVSAPSAVLIRPAGHVAWVGDGTDQGLRDALTTWFGPPDLHET